eukprot:20921-Heterococcus_DN1.PRE.1
MDLGTMKSKIDAQLYASFDAADWLLLLHAAYCHGRRQAVQYKSTWVKSLYQKHQAKVDEMLQRSSVWHSIARHTFCVSVAMRYGIYSAPAPRFCAHKLSAGYDLVAMLAHVSLSLLCSHVFVDDGFKVPKEHMPLLAADGQVRGSIHSLHSKCIKWCVFAHMHVVLVVLRTAISLRVQRFCP